MVAWLFLGGNNKMTKPIIKHSNKLRCFFYISLVALCWIACLYPAGIKYVEGADSGQFGELRYVYLSSKEVGVVYTIGIATPPGYHESGGPYPAIFALDGAYYLQTFREWFYEDDQDIIIVAVINSDRRNTDYMPTNSCTPNGGGNDAFLNFLVKELVPYLDQNYSMSPSLRLLFGHSHGGSFVFYTLFTDHGENFPLLLSTDASISCNLPYFQDLARAYKLTNNNLPAVFYAAGASEGNAQFVQSFMHNYVSNIYEGLVSKYEGFQGSHDGILSNALPNGIIWIGSQIELPSYPNRFMPFILLLLDD